MTKQYWIIIAVIICALVAWRAPIVVAFILVVIHDDAPVFLVGCAVGWFVRSRRHKL